MTTKVEEIDGKLVTEIGYDAFNGCTGLTQVTIPDSVTEIGRDTFYAMVVLPDGGHHVTY